MTSELPERRISADEDKVVAENVDLIPIGSMYGIFTYIWLIFMVNVAKYSIHGASGIGEIVLFGEHEKYSVWKMTRSHSLTCLFGYLG